MARLIPEELFDFFGGFVDSLVGGLAGFVAGLIHFFEPLGFEGFGGFLAEFAGVGDGGADVPHQLVQDQVNGLGEGDSLAASADVIHFDSGEADGLTAPQGAHVDAAFFDDELADDDLLLGCGLGGGFLVSLIGRAGEGLDVFLQFLDVGGPELFFVADGGRDDMDFIDHDGIAEDGAGIELDVDLAQGKDIFALETFGVADNETFERAAPGEGREVDGFECDGSLRDLWSDGFHPLFDAAVQQAGAEEVDEDGGDEG